MKILLACAALLIPTALFAAEPPARKESNVSVRNEVLLSIDKGLAWLKQQQKANGSIANPENGEPAAQHPALTALPLSQAEIEELLYGDDRPVVERVERLQELAGLLREQEPGDFGDNDPGALIGEIEEAIARLTGGLDGDPDVVFDETTMDDDPLNHRETLSPDSDELEDIEEEDEASLSDGSEPRDDSALDPEEWSEDSSDIDRGVR